MLKTSKYALFFYALFITIGTAIYLLPLFTKFDRFLHLDWDQHLFFHSALVTTIKEYFQMPFWNPWYCGGHVLFANPQSRLLTPFFILHLLIGELSALKIEIFLHYLIGFWGMALIAKNIYHISNPLYYFFPSALFLLNLYPIAHFSVGHTNFLCLTYIPLVYYHFQKAILKGHPLSEIWAALFLALMIFEGGVYIFPYTLVFLAVYTLTHFLKKKSPIYLLTSLRVIGFTFLFSSIKLLPVLSFMNRNPRPIGHVESFPLSILPKMFFTPFEKFAVFQGLYYRWDEYTAYIGVTGFLMLLFAIIYSIRSLKYKTNYIISIFLLIFFLSLSLGANQHFGIYDILRNFPIFSQLRVPSRFSIMALFTMSLLIIVFLKNLDKKRSIKVHVLVLTLSLAIFFDLSNNAWKILNDAIKDKQDTFNSLIENNPPQRFRQKSEPFPRYSSNHFSSMYLTTKSNTRTLECYEVLRIKKRPKNILLSNDIVYGKNKSTIISNILFSPNKITFDAVVTERDQVILNQNFEKGWQTSDPSRKIYPVMSGPAFDIEPGSYKGLDFVYFPTGFKWGSGLTMLGIVLAFFYVRRFNRQKVF